MDTLSSLSTLAQDKDKNKGELPCHTVVRAAEEMMMIG